MAKVVDIEEVRIERLAAQIMPALREGLTGSGSYFVRVDDLDDAERFRRAARKCARELKIPIRTGISTDGTTIWIVNNNLITPERRAEANRRLREVARDSNPEV